MWSRIAESLVRFLQMIFIIFRNCSRDPAAYHSGRWRETKYIQNASTAFSRKNAIATAILNALKSIKLYLEVVV